MYLGSVVPRRDALLLEVGPIHRRVQRGDEVRAEDVSLNIQNDPGCYSMGVTGVSALSMTS